MKKGIVLIFITLCYLQINTLAQNSTSQITKIKNLLELSKQYADNNDYDNAIKYCHEAADIQKKTLGENHIEYAGTLQNLTELYIYLEKFDDAIKTATTAINIYNKNANDKATKLSLALTSYFLSLSYNGNENYENAITVCKKASDLLFNIFGGKNDLYLETLNDLSIYYANLHNYSKSIETQLVLADLIKKNKGKKSKEYAMQLFKLAFYYSLDENYAQAVKIGEQAAAIQKETLGKNHTDYHKTLTNLANDYNDAKNHLKAIEICEYLVEMVKNTKGEQSSEYAKQLLQLSKMYEANNETAKAVTNAETAANIQRKINDNKNLLSTLNLLLGIYTFSDFQKAIAVSDEMIDIIYKTNEISQYFDTYIPICIMAYIQTGMCEKAEKLLMNIQNIVTKEYNKNGKEYIDMLGLKIDYYAAIGKNVEAIEVQRQILDIIKDKTDETYINALMNLANYFYYIGNKKQSDLLGVQALDLAKKNYGDNNVRYLSILQQINLEDKNLALEKAKEARRLSEKIFENEKNNRKNIRSYSNLAFQYAKVNDFKNALEQINNALSLCGENYSKINLNLNLIMKCYYMTALAVIDGRTELLPQAVETGEIALKYIKSQTDSRENEMYQAFLEPMYAAYFYSGSVELAAKLYQQEFNIIQNKVINNFRTMTALERSLFWTNTNNQKIITDYSFVFGLFSKGLPLFQDLAFDGAIFSKGLLLNSELSLHSLILESGNTSIINMFETLTSNNVTLKYIYKQPEKNRNQAIIDSLEQKSQSIEHELMQRSQVFGDYTRNLTVKWQNIQQSLSDKDIAIEFVDFNPIIFDTIVPSNRIYAALLLKKGWEHPKMIRLFQKGTLDSLVIGKNFKLFKDVNMETDQNQIYESRALGDLIWSPLEEHLKDVKNIYFAPSGVLHQLAIEYLPTSKGNMQELFNLYRLSSTRQLAITKPVNQEEKTALYGGLNYDSKNSKRDNILASDDKKLASAGIRKVVGELSLSGIHAEPLPYTVQEIENINNLLSKKNINSVVFSGSEGTESSFKALSGQKIKRLHIATHGFYLPEDETSESFQFLISDNSYAPKEDLSLNRSGLLMAGANATLSNENIISTADDGILTAKEIAQTDLRGLDLVVLSACQTGLGEITGEGVFGLQRGFKKAGAQTLLMSLWSVSDEATAIMMSGFYKYLLSGKSKREAFMSAQNDLRSYEKNGEKVFDKPQFWAAFILLDS